MSQIETVASESTRFTVNDMCQMAIKLIARHGSDAAGIADYFSKECRILGDGTRAEAWDAVQSLVADMLAGQPLETNPTLH